MMLLIGALVCIGLIGYLAQNIGICMARGDSRMIAGIWLGMWLKERWLSS